MTTEETKARHPTPLLPSDLGEMRTIMAADRTLMAWIRTSLSMLSFGFTIYKVMQSLAERDVIARSESPRDVGLFLAAVGTASMVLGTIGYWTTLRDLRRLEEFRIGRPVLIIALIMSLAGIGLFISILMRVI